MKKNKALSHLFFNSYEAERNLRHFSTASSAELTALLGAVVGEIEYALLLEDAKAREQVLRQALVSAERAVTTSRNLKYFASSTRLDLKPADLSQLILDAVDQIESLFSQARIELHVRVESGVRVVMDSSAIAQALLNLLWFSYFSLPHGGKLSVSLQLSKTSLEISLGHNGQGFSAEQLERIFEPYGSDLMGKDRGLGLTVAKAIFESHGGEIQAHSNIGQGTNFFVRLPYDPGASKPVLHSEKRRHRRVSVDLPVEVQLGRRKLRSHLTTLSVGGCFVALGPEEMREVPARGAELSLRVFCQGNEIVEVKRARVASVVPAEGYTGLGIEFLEVDIRGQKLVRALVRAHLA